MGQLEQNTGPVPRVRFSATGATMTEMFEDGERLADNSVRSLPFDIDNKPDAARIMLILGII
jgi:hypothetical protein